MTTTSKPTGERKYKIRDKRYARPLILTPKEYLSIFEFEFNRLNPGKNFRDEVWD